VQGVSCHGSEIHYPAANSLCTLVDGPKRLIEHVLEKTSGPPGNEILVFCPTTTVIFNWIVMAGL
jgi:hypothetical protein